MARLGGNPVLAPVDSLYKVAGRLTLSGTTLTAKAGKGFSLTYVSTGVYTITPDINYPYVLGGAAILMSATHLYNITVQSYVGLNNAGTGGTAGSITLSVTNSGSAVDIGATDELWFTFDFCRSVKQ